MKPGERFWRRGSLRTAVEEEVEVIFGRLVARIHRIGRSILGERDDVEEGASRYLAKTHFLRPLLILLIHRRFESGAQL